MRGLYKSSPGASMIRFMFSFWGCFCTGTSAVHKTRHHHHQFHCHRSRTHPSHHHWIKFTIS